MKYVKMTPNFIYFFLLFDLIDLISSVKNDTLLISIIIFDLLVIFAPSALNVIIWIVLRSIRGFITLINKLS
jgi:hypothetical protein